MSKRRNGEASIFPYRNGYAAYAWVTTPDGERKRKWVYGKTHDEVHQKWIKLQTRARQGPMPTTTPTLASYLTYWLREVVEPNLAPKTTERYLLLTRLYLIPGLGDKRMDRLQVRDIRTWLNRLRTTCQCCAQGKDAARPSPRRRCCAIGACCRQVLSDRTIKDIRDVLRAALTNAVAEELLPRNVAAVVRLPNPRKPQRQWWSVEEARAFLESARRDHDPLYAAYVLILVLGLRRGEALGLTWPDVNFDAAEVHIRWQLQRAGHQILHRETKTPGSAAVLPLPDICLTALKLRAERQAADKSQAADAWQAPQLVFTSTYGTPYEPRNFNRQFAVRCRKAGVRYIRVHDTRRTCASLLVALDVHPRVAMQILRHSQIAMTMEVYSEVPTDKTRSALKRLGRQLDG
ncbi:MAG: tyrosine recombinase XerC [Streptosporangiaceae bacterium]